LELNGCSLGFVVLGEITEEMGGSLFRLDRKGKRSESMQRGKWSHPVLAERHTERKKQINQDSPSSSHATYLKTLLVSL